MIKPTLNLAFLLLSICLGGVSCTTSQLREFSGSTRQYTMRNADRIKGSVAGMGGDLKDLGQTLSGARDYDPIPDKARIFPLHSKLRSQLGSSTDRWHHATLTTRLGGSELLRFGLYPTLEPGPRTFRASAMGPYDPPDKNFWSILIHYWAVSAEFSVNLEAGKVYYTATTFNDYKPGDTATFVLIERIPNGTYKIVSQTTGVVRLESRPPDLAPAPYVKPRRR
jgi:hypothetical protein